MPTYRVSELSGDLLDAAVWVARGNEVRWGVPCDVQRFAANVPAKCWLDVTGWQVPRVSSDWSAAGMLIEQYGAALDHWPARAKTHVWRSAVDCTTAGGNPVHYGPTALVAAMRAIVASQHRETIELPDAS